MRRPRVLSVMVVMAMAWGCASAVDIYLKTAMDGQVYLLHSLRDFESPFIFWN